jgi:hypothetical protein
MEFRKPTTKEKALAINLDPKIYGSFAEIGAGQETAANFFKAGGASGTIAKTMSAYDMAFSDAIYGVEESGRYVCEPRLIKMLHKEYRLLGERLPKRAPDTRFFAFANTVEALNYRRTNQGHGWLGVRFQLRPMSPPNECVIHVQMHDNDALLQQQALGVIGVNLLYGCYFHAERPEELLNSLLDGLDRVRIEIDFFRLSGPDFPHIDNRLFSLKLVKNGLTSATMFGPDGGVLLPADTLYKRNILVLRGRFRPPTHVNLDMLRSGYRQFLKDAEVDADRLVVLSELTLNNLLSQDGHDIDEKDFLDRVDILCSMGQTVMISDYQEYFKLISFLSKYTRNKRIGVILGINNLMSIFDERYYAFLKGGILESFGILFGSNVKMFVYPSLNEYTGELNTCKTAASTFPPNLIDLYEYLVVNNKIEDIEGVDEDLLHIVSDNVLAMIKSGEDGWEHFVPPLVEQAIKEQHLFNYSGPKEAPL